jgi:hypothetical protein
MHELACYPPRRDSFGDQNCGSLVRSRAGQVLVETRISFLAGEAIYRDGVGGADRVRKGAKSGLLTRGELVTCDVEEKSVSHWLAGSADASASSADRRWPTRSPHHRTRWHKPCRWRRVSGEHTSRHSVGFVFGGVVDGPESESGSRHARSRATLLNDVGQLMRKETSTLCGAWTVCAGSEGDVVPDGVGASVDGVG